MEVREAHVHLVLFLSVVASNSSVEHYLPKLSELTGRWMHQCGRSLAVSSWFRFDIFWTQLGPGMQKDTLLTWSVQLVSF